MKIHIFFFNKKEYKVREVGYFERLDKGGSNPIKRSKERGEGFLLGKKRIKKNGTQDESPIRIKNSSVKFDLFWIILAAWPSGKAGDCKSFFPSSNPGVA
jgi:hypothetical protein